MLVSSGVEMRHNDHNNFKKQLESKMETLFNEEKSLLRNRYEVSVRRGLFRMKRSQEGRGRSQ